MLDQLFRQALYAGKKVRTETAISESPTSVASAAAALAQQVFGDLEGRAVVVVGAGEIGELTARNLAKRGGRIFAVANRGEERSAALARRFGAQGARPRRARARAPQADVVVSSTSAPGYVLGAEQVRAALARRKGLPLLLIDIAVPRDLDPAIHALESCYLYDIDDLEAVVGEPRRPPRGGRARRVDRRLGGRALQRLAGVARRRSGDRRAARAGGGDPRGRARPGRRARALSENERRRSSR